MSIPSQNLNAIDRLARQVVLAKLQQIEHGHIIWLDGSEQHFGDVGSELAVRVQVHHPVFYRQFAWRGSIGAAESFIDGQWSCDHLLGLMKIIAQSSAVMSQLEAGLSACGHMWRTIGHCLRPSGIQRAKRNIKYHYDLSNDFFHQFLDQQMVYSSAIFENSQQSLEQAQLFKLQKICQQLKLSKDDHLLEIGTGWGALAIYTAQHFNCQVTTTTISDAQFQYVQQKVHQLGLTDRICLIKQDYRQLTGQFDKLVSIEMIESIGYRQFNGYFKVCDQLLKPGGLCLIQSIVIQDQTYDRYKREVDFIKAYIFPGGCLPGINTITHAVKRFTSMRLIQMYDFGHDYAQTLTHWRDQMIKNQQKIKSIGFSEKVIRQFLFYFDYCRAGFLCNKISVGQFLFKK
ncbi:cyclopropane-fatty-acyl-phospholipid synthase family protein [Gammaproteobacteria bacterium]|nr:cyclopropane-fatty-acyl-phospholipid synthase family protein [Gammaproteobacteria bacterium]